MSCLFHAHWLHIFIYSHWRLCSLPVRSYTSNKIFKLFSSLPKALPNPPTKRSTTTITAAHLKRHYVAANLHCRCVRRTDLVELKLTQAMTMFCPVSQIFIWKIKTFFFSFEGAPSVTPRRRCWRHVNHGPARGWSPGLTRREWPSLIRGFVLGLTTGAGSWRRKTEAGKSNLEMTFTPVSKQI